LAVSPAWDRACREYLESRDRLALLQAVQAVLFPEAFYDAGEVHPEGLVPRGGPPRCGADRLAGFGRLLADLSGRAG
jgi:hypothetical protein